MKNSTVYAETWQVSKYPRFSKRIILVPVLVNTSGNEGNLVNLGKTYISDINDKRSQS